MYGSGVVSSVLKPQDSRRSGSSIEGKAAPRESSIRRPLLDAVLTAALDAGTATPEGAVPEGDGSPATLRDRRPRFFELPRADFARDFLAIRYLRRFIVARRRDDRC
jgi:hypothetical protein